MSVLTPTQEAFLLNVLKVKPKKKGIFGGDKDDPRVKATTAFKNFQAKEKEVIAEIDKLKTHPGTDNEVQSLTGEVQAAQGTSRSDPSKAEEKLIAATNEFNVTLGKASAAVQKAVLRDKYNLDLPKAEQLARSLAAENRPGTDGKPAYKFDEPLLSVINEAKVKAGQELYAEASTALANVANLHKNQLKEAKNRRKMDLEGAEHKPVYLDKQRRVQEALAELKTMPGTKKQCDKLQELLNAGQVKADVGDFEAAYKALQGLSGAYTDGKKAAAAFGTTVGDAPFRTQRDAAENALKEYTKVAVLGDPQAIADARKKIDDALKELENEPDEDHVQDATEAMQELAESLNEKTGVIKKKDQELVVQFNKLDQIISREINPICASNEYEPLLSKLMSARTLRGAMQYDQAKNELTELETEAGNKLRECTQQKTDYDNLLQTFKTTHVPVIEEAMESSAVDLKLPASRVDTKFRNLETMLPNTHDYKNALGKLNNLITKPEGMPAVNTALEKFRLVKEQVRISRAAVEAKHNEVDKKLKELADAGGDPSVFEGRISTAVKKWDAGVTNVLKPGSDITALQNEIAGDGGAFATIIKEADDIIQDKPAGSLQTSKDSAKLAGDHAKFEQVARETLVLIRTLTEDDPVTGKRFKFDYDTCTLEAKRAFNLDRLREMEIYKRTAQEEIDRNALEVQATKRAADRALQEATKLLEKLEKAHKKNKAYFATLRNELTSYQGMAESTALSVAKEGTAKLVELKGKLETMKTANADDAPPGAKNFKAVEQKLAALKLLAEKATLVACLPSKAELFSYRLEKELPETCQQLDPEEALNGPLKEFEKTVGDDIKLAEKAKIKRQANQRTAGQLLIKINSLGDDAPRLKVKWLKQVAAAAKPTENGEAALELDLKALDVLITQAGEVGKRNEMEKTIRMVEFEGEKQQKTWTADSTVFEKNEKRNSKTKYDETPKKDRDESRYKFIGDAYDAAKKAAESGDYNLANSKLAEARQFAREFIENPLGAKLTARNNLKKVAQGWKQAATNFVKAVGKLKETVKTGATGDPTVKVDVVNKTLDRILRLFDIEMFDTVVTILADEDDVKARRKAKEDALQFVRSYKKVLASDKVVQHLLGNPFAPPGPISTAFITAKLKDLEANLLRA